MFFSRHIRPFAVRTGHGTPGRPRKIQRISTCPRIEELEGRVLLDASNIQVVQRLYYDLLQRPAENFGLQFWQNALDNGTSRGVVALGIIGSGEYRLRQIELSYTTLLGRSADLQGASACLNFLGAGGTIDQINAILVGSPEYLQRSGGTQAQFLAALFHDVLGRDIDPVARDAYTSALNHGVSRTDVAAVTFGSAEAQRKLVQQIYLRFLDRAPDEVGASFWATSLGQGTSQDAFLARILDSQEYFSHFVATPAPNRTNQSALAVPGAASDKVTTTFTLTGVNSEFSNEFGVFPVTDASGRIGAIKPGDDGYAAAALSESGQRTVFTQGVASGVTASIDLQGGSFVGLYLVQNGTTAEAFHDNPNNLLGQRPLVFFPFASANPDRIEHLQQTGDNQFSFEDLFGGGDRDFNDLIVRVNFAVPPPQNDVNPPTVTFTNPPAGTLTRANPTFTGLAIDDRSGIASVQAKVDGGLPFPVSFDGSGNFSFTTTLPLNGSADGVHTIAAQATDKAGNTSSFVATTFTLDTVPPNLQITSPTTALTTNSNVNISGQATDDRSGLAQVEGQVDGGSFAALTMDGSGNFAFATGLLLNGSADGQHVVQFRATDRAGNISTLANYTFTLDTVAPNIQITSPITPLTTNSNVTISGQATDDRSGVAKLEEQVDGGSFAALTIDGAGNFVFATGLLLDGTADGQHVVQFRATDQAGNVSTLATYTFTLSTIPTGGATLVEESRFRTIFQRMIVVPDRPSKLEFQFDSLLFDTGANFIKDAFEASLTDANGNSLVLPIEGSRDAFLNITEGQTPVVSPNVQVVGGTVDIDLSHIPAGTSGQLTIRLVNNDSDTTTTVHLSEPQVIVSAMNTPGAATSAGAPTPASNIDFSTLSDITTSITPTYGQTSLNEDIGVLFASLTIENSGSFPVAGPLVVAISHLSDPTVRVRNSNGTTPDGLPYFDFSGSIGGHTLAPGQSSAPRTLTFFNPNGVQFTYDLVVLGQLNRAPVFTSQPNTEAIPASIYTYQATATDADTDVLTFSLLSGPSGMAVDPATGKITWTPGPGNLGNQAVLLQVDDNHGGTAQQQFTVSTIVAPPNRPPVFTSVPVIDAAVNITYTYPAKARDDDGDPLTYFLGTVQTVPVTNPSFEEDALEVGSFTIGNISGWTMALAAAGAFRPGPGQFTGGTVPDGLNVAFNNGTTISQGLNEELTVGLHYELKVDVGNSLSALAANFSVELWAGSFLAGSSAPLPVDGGFATVTVAYDVPANSPLLGQHLEIRLISAGAQTCFDNVRLISAAFVDPSKAEFPAGMVIDAATGVVTWTPTAGQIGSQSVTVRAEDGRGGTAIQPFEVTVQGDPANHAPRIISQPNTLFVVTPPPTGRNLLTLDFEGLPAAPSFGQGTAIPPEARLSNQFLTTHGVTLRSASGVPFIAVVPLGVGHAQSGKNGIGGMQSTTTLDYATPIIAEFFLPNDPSKLALTDFVSIKVDHAGAGGTIFLDAFDVNGVLLQRTSATDFGGPTLAISTPGIHSIAIRGTSTTAFDDLGFREVYPAPSYLYDVDAFDPDHDALTYSLTTAPKSATIDGSSGLITIFAPSTPFSTISIDPRNTYLHTANDLSSSNSVPIDLASLGIQGGDFIRLDELGNFIASGSETKTDTVGVFSSSATLLDASQLHRVPDAIDAGNDVSTGPTFFGNEPNDISEDFGINTSASGGTVIQVPLSAKFLFVSALDSLWGDNTDPTKIYGVRITRFPSIPVTVQVDDGHGGSDTQSFVIVVAVANSGHIRGTAFNDLDSSGVRGPLEPGLPGSTVYLDQNHNGTRDPGEPVATTGIDGAYDFADLAPGVYTVKLEGQQGFQQIPPSTGTNDVTLGLGQDVSGFDLGAIQVATGERGPKITSTPPTLASVGQKYRYDVALSNPDGRSLTFDLPLAPAGMTVDAVTGVVIWDPTSFQVGQQNAVLRVRDDRGYVDVQPVTITVTFRNAVPVITSTPPSTAVAGLPYRYAVLAQDTDGDSLTYQLTVHPDAMVIDPATGVITLTATLAQVGDQAVTIVVSDGRGQKATQSFNLTVLATADNHPPIIASSPRTSIGLGNTYLYSVDVTDPDADPLTFSLPNAPAGMTIDASGLIRWQPLASQFGLNQVSVQVADGRGGLATQNFSIEVTNQTSNQPPSIVSIPGLAERVGDLYQYDARASDPDNDSVIWSLVTAPAGMSLDSSRGTLRWTASREQLGTQPVLLKATDASGGFTTQSFIITVRPGNTPPRYLSAPPTQAAVGQLYIYTAQAADVDSDVLTYSLFAAPAGMTIEASTGAIQWTPDAGQVGTQTVIVNVTDNFSSGTFQLYRVVVSATPLNRPPVITSTPPLASAAGQDYQYSVTATDPDGPAPSFSLLVAPVGMNIDPVSGVLRWTPTAGQGGNNLVTVVATDAQGASAAQTFGIVVNLDINHPPSISSAPPASAAPGLIYHYDVHATDPDGDRLTYSLTAGPAAMVIDALGRITWSPQTGDIGNQPISVKVEDGRGGFASQSFTISVAADTEAPQVSLVLSANPADLGTTVLVSISATDNVGVTGLTLTIDGVAVALDAAGHAIIPAVNFGSFVLVARANDAAGNVGTDGQTLVVRDPHVTGSPLVDLTSPTMDASITGPTEILGTVQDANLVSYTLAIAPSDSNAFTTFFTGTSQVTSGLLGTLDPSMLQNDTYVIRLTAINAGGFISTVETTLNVSGNLKLGNFTLSFTDLTVPVSGIPITVTRTYDTLNAGRSEDFGFGWRLEFRNVDLRTSVAKTGNETDSFFNPFQNGSRVYLTLPGGQREGFTFQLKLADGLRGAFLGIFEPTFVPDDGSTDSLTVTPADLRVDAAGTVYDYVTGLAYNPADPNFGGSYLLTTKDGIAYDIDGITGQLTQVSDSNNNTLTFSDAGIVSSTGSSVSFERDFRGRINAVVDPMGNRIQYKYDSNGDLVAVTDRTSNTTQFVYRSTPAHYLDRLIDPLGRTGLRTDYDAQGRLTRIIDAAGNPVQLTYDPTHSIETVTDQLGNSVTYEYDERGNIVTQTDALGAITRRTYDANNNLLTETDPLGRTITRTFDDRRDVLTQTDPLGNTTLFTYQAFTFFATALAATRGQAAAPFTRLTSVTNALGDTSQNRFDFFGNLVAQTDPLGSMTTMSNDRAGNLAAITDPLGNVTQNKYDAAGNRTKLIDADGHTTNFTYDANGNPLSQTQANGSGWSVAYNANGMPTNLGPTGLARTVQYDGVNQITQVGQPTGQASTLAYDVLGNVTQITLPDGTTAQTTTYDAVGNVVAVTDSLGNVTRYAYDADKRLVLTTYPDGTTEKRTYDLAGELVNVTDALGNSTGFVYDGAGRQIQIINALGGISSTLYDAAGRVIATTNPLGRTSRFQYDALGRQVAAIGPDGSTTRNAYDAAGRLVQTVDAAGSVTTNAYDSNDNLISVTDALGHVTSYQYGDNNERVSITDANGNVTRFRYDTQGHLVETIQPGGEINSTTFDAFGQRASTTNGNNQTIQYGYDARGRLTSVTLPDGSQETYSYTSDGLLSSVTDASGIRAYEYDPVMRRLVRVTEPDGRYIRYAYDARGARTLLADSIGAGLAEEVTRYAYDALGRLVQITDPQGGITTDTYDANGNLTASSLPNGVTETYTYDTWDRVVDIVARNQSGVTIGGFDYTLDVNGNRTREDDADGSHQIYTYDALNRVTAEEHFDSSGLSTGSEVYNYDAVGNVTSRSGTLLADATFTYNGDNQLLSGAGSTYTYDAAGNLASVTDSTGNVTRYTFDARRRLISSQAPDGATSTFTYDFQGIRQSQQGPGGLIKYLLDAANGPNSAQVVRESNSTGATLRSYVIGTRLLSGNEGGNIRYYLTDGLGSTRLLTDATGAVTDAYRYSAYGVLLGHTGSSTNPFQFAGQQQDGPSGLVYLRARYYDPATGRFLSRDAFPGSDQRPLSLNRYLYALANPVNYTDPSGNFTLAELQIAQAEEEETNAVSVAADLNSFKDLVQKILQNLGGALTLFTALEAVLDPGKLGEFFGGVLLPGPVDTTLGIASEFYLVRTAARMLGKSAHYLFDPAPPGSQGADALAKVSGDYGNTIYVFPPYILAPLFPVAENPLADTKAGTLIHEFVHLVSKGRVGDYAYGKASLGLDPLDALRNADNYMIAVQASLFGLSALEVLQK